MTFPAGEYRDRECRFIDETHLEVGNSLYHICEFAERIQRECIQIIPLRQSLPEKCFSALEATGEIITVTKGEKGYTPTGQYPQNGVSPKEAAAALNDAAGVTKAQEAAMVSGSMFGWDTAQSFNIENINAISQSWSAIGGDLIIDTLGDDIRIGESARDVVNSIIVDFDTVLQSVKTPKGGAVIQQASAADELKKFKELLDMGVITQEEFDAKKKQLLGL